MKIVAVIVTEGVAPGVRGLDIKGLMTHLCAPLPLLVDFLHATVFVDVNPLDVGALFPVALSVIGPGGEILAESRTRTGFAVGVQGAPSVVTFPLGALILNLHGPHMVDVQIGPASGSAAFGFQE